MGRYNHSLSPDATNMVSKHCLTIGKHVVTIVVTVMYRAAKYAGGDLPCAFDSGSHIVTAIKMLS